MNVARLELSVSDQVVRHASVSEPFIKWLVDAIGETRVAHAPQEIAWVVTLNNHNRVYSIVEVGRGSNRAIYLHVPSMLQAVLASGCDRFIYIHSHPSGVARATADDVDSTEIIANAAAACGIVLEDSIIITRDPREYTSLRRAGLFFPAEDPYGASHVPASEHEALDDVPRQAPGDTREEPDEEGSRQVRSPVFKGVPDA